jgi:tetratricopeptide (TPR) repeat protein
VLRAASAFGTRFAQDGVVALLGGNEAAQDVREQLEMLAASEVIQRSSPSGSAGEDAYVFRHALVREATYAMMTEDDRRLGHRLAGEHLEASHDADAALLAEHFARGGAPARAARWYRRATEKALEGDDLTAAIALGMRALDCAEDDQVRGAVLMVLAEAHMWRSEDALARERATAAMRMAPRYSTTWFRAVAELITACTSHGEIAAAVPYLRMAAEAEVCGAEKAEQVSCVARGCSRLLYVGQGEDEAQRLIERVLGPHADLASLGPSALARVSRFRAARAMQVGDAGAYLENTQAALDAFDSMGQARNVCTQRGNLGYACIELGEFARAEQLLTQVLATTERLGLKRVAAYAVQNLSTTLACAGRAADAHASATRAVQLSREIQDPRAEGSSRTYLSRLALDAGNVDVALTEAQAAVDILAQHAPFLALARAALAAALLRAERREEARAAIDAAMAFVDSHGGIEDGEARVRLVYIEVLSALGEHERARVAIVAARDRLLARAARITNPAWRESFLTRVPDNVRTMRLAEQSEKSPQN